MFVLSRLSEKFRAKNNKLFYIFVDLERASDRVLRDKGSYLFSFEAEVCPRIFSKWGYVSL